MEVTNRNKIMNHNSFEYDLLHLNWEYRKEKKEQEISNEGLCLMQEYTWKLGKKIEEPKGSLLVLSRYAH